MMMCHCCGYSMDAATVVGLPAGWDGLRFTDRVRQMPAGAVAMCIACGAFGLIDDDGAHRPLPLQVAIDLFQEQPFVLGIVVARARSLSCRETPDGAPADSVHPFRRIAGARWS